jgi:hypothetical protein
MFTQMHNLPNLLFYRLHLQAPVGAAAFLFTESANADFKTLAETYRGQAVFSTSTAEFDRLNQYLGVDPANFPIFVLLVCFYSVLLSRVSRSIVDVVL